MEERRRLEIKAKINKFKSYQLLIHNKRDIKVACILDDFSYRCFEYECDLQQLKKKIWQKQLQGSKPAFVFVESAWKGVDGDWQGHISDLQNDPEQEIFKLTQYCKEHGIKTVFWNKEDPNNYKYFIEAAKLFDVIFTTDINCIEKYKQDTKHGRVYVLPFAAQPALHNPVGCFNAPKEKVAFAGSWYNQRHFLRGSTLYMLLDAAKDFGLHIFDRNLNLNATEYKFPEEFSEYIVDGLSYEEMIKAYKLYKVFLNVNANLDSPTMVSRRVFELLACGTNVVSSFSLGMQELFGDIVPLCNSKNEVKKHLRELLINPDLSHRLSVLGIREVYLKHLYSHRFNYILEKVDLQVKEQSLNKVSVMGIVDSTQSMNRLLNSYLRQVWPEKELILAIKKIEGTLGQWEDIFNKYQAITIYQLPEKYTYEECINFLADKAVNKYLTILHEENYYAPNFLTDLMLAFAYTDADIVGKGTYYNYIEQTQRLILQFPGREHCFVNSLSETAFIFKREVLDMLRLENISLKEGPAFFEKCILKGLKLYSTDRYNFVCNINGHVEYEELVTI